jgi:hypothetical protein
MATYQYWMDALNGNFGAVHDGHPQLGFFKRRHKNKADGVSWTAVAIWSQDGIIHAVDGGKTVDASEVWVSCCERPITEEVYRRVERGEGWPDAIESLIGNNNPPAAEAEADEILSAINAALEQLKTPVASQTDCDRLANHRERLSKLYKAQEEKRKKEKQPYMDAAKAVDEGYRPILARIEEAGTKIKKAITAWLLKEEQKRRDEAAKAVAKGEEIKPVETPKAGTTGHVTALRTYKSATITDYSKALQFFSENAEVKGLIQTLADRAARTDIAVPGCEIKIEKRAA